MNKYYKPSGKFSPVSFLYFIIACFAGLPLLGLLYAYAIWYIPFFYFHFIFTVIFGGLVGVLAIGMGVIKLGKVRNRAIGIFFGFFGGLVALYFHWAVWVDFVMNIKRFSDSSSFGMPSSEIHFNEVFSYVKHPAAFFQLIADINEKGVWTLRSLHDAVNGPFLSFIWIVEALIVLAGSMWGANITSKKPFCEVSKTWFEEKTLPAFSYIQEKEKVISSLENDDADIFKDIVKAENLKESHSIFTVYYSKNEEYYLTIKNKTVVTDKNGKVKFKDDEFIEYISIDRTLREMLIAKGSVSAPAVAQA